MYIYLRCFVQCYRAHYVISVDSVVLTKVFLSLRIHNIYIENMHNRALYTYINMYVYEPALEVAVPTVFMV